MFGSEKRFVYSDRGFKAIDCVKWYLHKGIVPLITVDKVENSKVYKQIDRFLVENGFNKTLVKEKKIEIFESVYKIVPAHYEYTIK